MDAELGTRTRNKYSTINQIPIQIQKAQLKDDKKQLKVKIPEFRFHQNRERLLELLNKEADFISKTKNKSIIFSNILEEERKHDDKKNEENENFKISEEKDKKSVESEQFQDQQNHENTEANGLTPEENVEKDMLLATGFNNWNKHEFHAFVQGCERFSRKDYFKISEV